MNQLVVIATGRNCCDYIYDSSASTNRTTGNGKMTALSYDLLVKLEEFVVKDEKFGKEESNGAVMSSLLSGSLSMALCCILKIHTFDAWGFVCYYFDCCNRGGFLEKCTNDVSLHIYVVADKLFRFYHVRSFLMMWDI